MSDKMKARYDKVMTAKDFNKVNYFANLCLKLKWGWEGTCKVVKQRYNIVYRIQTIEYKKL